jgi:DNA-binding transcriptional ArsR family regulator
MRRDSFQAIADPTRRAIIGLLALQPMNLNAVAENFKISRPAISKQIKILAECGLIRMKKRGRERFCEIRLEKLEEVSDFIEKYRVFWSGKMDALENFLLNDQKTISKLLKNQKNE